MASWGERLTRISAEITDVKRVVVVVVLYCNVHICAKRYMVPLKRVTMSNNADDQSIDRPLDRMKRCLNPLQPSTLGVASPDVGATVGQMVESSRPGWGGVLFKYFVLARSEEDYMRTIRLYYTFMRTIQAFLQMLKKSK